MKKTLIVGLLLVGVASWALADSTARHAAPLGDHEVTNDALRRLDNAIPPTKHGGPSSSVIFCGELSVSNGTTYLGPAFADTSGGGEGAALDAGDTICTALDNATEGTADLPLFTNIPIYVTGMYCRAVTDSGATGSGANGVTFNLRINAAAASPALSCTVPTSGLDCYAAYGRDVDLPVIGAAVPADIQAVDTETGLTATDGWCRVFYTF